MPTKYPPALDLNDAIRIIKDIYVIHANQRFNMDSLDPKLLNTSKNSSYFPRRIAALQTFGLLNKQGEHIQLTDLAVQIVNPVAGEDVEAIHKAFDKVDVLQELLGRYPNAKLPPESDTLKQVLLKSLGIDRDGVTYWYEFVVNSFKAISPKSHFSLTLRDDVKQPSEETKNVSTILQAHGLMQNFELPSGNKFEFSLPTNITIDDLDFIIGFLELKKKNVAK
ncbi:MAG: hypothetical protein ABSD46_08770 [Bacteroidota bacterium]